MHAPKKNETMIDFMTYLLEVNLLLALFAGAYLLLFRSSPHHIANRLVLNGSLLTAFVLPLWSWSVPAASELTVLLPPITLQSVVESSTTASTSPAIRIPFAVYTTGATVALIMALRGAWSLVGLMKRRRVIPGTSRYVVTAPGLKSGSFMRTLFLDSNLDAKEKEVITAHETVHIEELHSVDVLVFRAAAIFCWWNPAAYLLQRMLLENHEFRADDVVRRRFENRVNYADLLLSHAMGVSGFPILPFSNRNLLKRRIMMITDNTPSRSWRYALLPLLVAPALLIHSCTKDPATEEPGASPSETPRSETSTPVATPQSKNAIYSEVEQMPTFPGGTEAMVQFLSENIKYPEGVENEEPSTVHVSFVIDEEGHVTQTEVKKSSDPAFSAAALAAVDAMPTWNPGYQDGNPVKVQMMLPIRFQLD